MPTLARRIVDQARDLHPSFDPLHLPDVTVYRALGRYQTRLVEKITQLNEEALAVPVVFPKADVDAAALAGRAGLGLLLPPHLLLVSLETVPVAGGQTEEVYLTTYANVRDRSLSLFPAAYLIGQRLYPVHFGTVWPIKGDTHGWETWDGLTAVLVPTPATALTPQDEVSLPETADDALVANLGLWMGGVRGVLRDNPWIQQNAQDAEAQAIATLGGQDTTSHWTVTR